jgi:hypothetical protein
VPQAWAEAEAAWHRAESAQHVPHEWSRDWTHSANRWPLERVWSDAAAAAARATTHGIHAQTVPAATFEAAWPAEEAAWADAWTASERVPALQRHADTQATRDAAARLVDAVGRDPRLANSQFMQFMRDVSTGKVRSVTSALAALRADVNARSSLASLSTRLPLNGPRSLPPQNMPRPLLMPRGQLQMPQRLPSSGRKSFVQSFPQTCLLRGPASLPTRILIGTVRSSEMCVVGIRTRVLTCVTV